MNCPSCGTELPGGAKFCFNCGNEVPADAATPSDLPPPAASPPPRPIPQRPVPRRPGPPSDDDDELSDVAAPIPMPPPAEVPVSEEPAFTPPPPLPEQRPFEEPAFEEPAFEEPAFEEPQFEAPPFTPPPPPPPIPGPPGDDVPIPTEPPHLPADDIDEPLTPPPPRPVYGAYARGETRPPDDEPIEFPTEPPHDLPSTPPSPSAGPPPDVPLRLSLGSDEPTRVLPDEPHEHEVDPTRSYVSIEEARRPVDGPLIAGRNWFAGHKLLTALLAAAVIAIIVLAILSARDDTPETGAIASPVATAQTSPVVTTSPGAATTSPGATAPGAVTSPGASPATSTATTAPGGAIRDGNMEFAVTNTECGNDSAGDLQAEGQFCYVAVTAKNNGTAGKTLRIEDQKMFLGDGREFAGDREAWSRLPEDDKAIFKEIAPGAQVEGVVIFDIPDGQTPARVVLHESGTSNGASIPVRTG